MRKPSHRELAVWFYVMLKPTFIPNRDPNILGGICEGFADETLDWFKEMEVEDA
jgi:hypothetical protein